MASNMDEIQDAVLATLRGALAQPVVEQGIPDIDTVKRNGVGDIDPYYALQFGTNQQGRSRSMIGPRGDDYIMPMYLMSIAPSPEIARRMYNRATDVLLGEGYPWTGNVRQRPGGGMFTMTNSDNATEAFTFPASFGLLVQFE